MYILVPLRNRKYDVTFILPNPTYNIPPGGYDVIFRITQAMKENGFKCSIIFINNRKYLIWNLIKLFFGKDRISIFYRLLPTINRLRKLDYGYGILRGVDLYFINSVDEISFTTKAVIATGWTTALPAFKIKEKIDCKGYYLIQNSEDHVSFSGKDSVEASKTYSLPLKKIVINDELLKRFSSEQPIYLQIGFNNALYKRIEGIKKIDNMVLMPLREGRSKGSQEGLKAFEILHFSKKEIKLVAFGDMEKVSVPAYVDYYFRPPNGKLLELYNEASVFILPSIVEGFPTPPLEAMSCGCALVTTKNGGTDKYALNEVNCLVSNSGQPEEIAELVLRLLEDRSLRSNICKNGYETSIKYSIDFTTFEFTEIMKEELSN